MSRFESFKEDEEDDVVGGSSASDSHVQPSVLGMRDSEAIGARDSPVMDSDMEFVARPVDDLVSNGKPKLARGDSAEGEWRRRVVKSLKKPWAHKQQAPTWDSARTVEMHEDASLVASDKSRWKIAAQSWSLAIAIGVLCFLTYVVIEVGVGAMSSGRFGYCKGKPFRPEKHCHGSAEWIFWERGVTRAVAYIGLGTAMATGSAWLVYRFAPTASGSGIPEVKTILNGFVLTDVLTFRTLCIKVPGLILAVSSGMSLGHEGPMVHLSACWANILSRRLPNFRSEARQRELLSAAVAAGIASAFSTPIGGVLFSLEEVSSYFPSRTLLLAFVASVVATLLLSVADLTGTGKLTLYSVTNSVSFHPSEYVIFAMLGATGGLVGAIFNSVNIRWNAFRMTPEFKSRVHPVAEVAVVAFLTLVSSYPFPLLQRLNEETIHALFDTCTPSNLLRDRLQAELGLCTSDGSSVESGGGLLLSLWLACIIRFCHMTFTIGTVCPAGLFVPSLFIGACLGRGTAGIVKSMENWSHPIDPGVYSMVGAAAVLGGVTRMTISLVVIMLELTGGLDYVVPFMLSVLLAKAVGDSLNEGIYDLQIVLKGYPFLHEEVDVTFVERVCDIMETRLTKLDIGEHPRMADVQAMLKSTTYRGFPIVDGDCFVGYAKRTHLNDLLVPPHDVLKLDDLRLATDATVMRMVPGAPLSQVHLVFKQLGCHHIFVVGSQGPGMQDALLGMLSKKNFLSFLKDGRVGHMRERIMANGSDAASVPEEELNRLRSSGSIAEPAAGTMSVLGRAFQASSSANLDASPEASRSGSGDEGQV